MLWFLEDFASLSKPPPADALSPPITCDYGMPPAADSHQAVVALDNAADPSSLHEAPPPRGEW